MLLASCYVAKPFLINMNVHVPARKVSNSYCSTYQVADVILVYFVTSFFFWLSILLRAMKLSFYMMLFLGIPDSLTLAGSWLVSTT